jgi:hypothetical protein
MAINRATTSVLVSLLATGPSWPAATVTNLATRLSFIRLSTMHNQIPCLFDLLGSGNRTRTSRRGTFVANLQRFPTV